MSDSVWPHRRQPTRLPRPWDSPGKNTGVGHHFLLQCTKVKSESEVAQSCLTLSDPMDCSLPGRILRPWDFPGSTGKWGATAFSERDIYLCANRMTMKIVYTIPSGPHDLLVVSDQCLWGQWGALGKSRMSLKKRKRLFLETPSREVGKKGNAVFHFQLNLEKTVLPI